MNDIAKQLAINCQSQAEIDQYVVDHADYFQCVYKTAKTNLVSQKFANLADVRNAAVFANELMTIYRGKKHNGKLPNIKVMAYLQDSKGRAISALVEEITPASMGAING